MATQLFQPPHGTPAWLSTVVERAKDAPIMEVVDLTPSLAKALLDSNFDNRSIRKSKLAQYSADMAGGRWTLNGEPIIVARDGKLNDGQHRCLAAIDANATVPVMLVFGVDRESRLTVDQGGARSASDFLCMEGMPNGALVAAIARLAIAYERVNGVGVSNAAFVTSAEIRERAARDVALAEAATFGSTQATYTRKFAPASLIGFAYYVLARIDRRDAAEFLERVCRGDGLSAGSPMHTLREKLLSAGKAPRDQKLTMFFKVWNFYRRGTKKLGLSSLNTNLPFPSLI